MDARTFGAIERAIRSDMTAEERARIGRVIREVAATEALEALLGEKAVGVSEVRLCPRCGAAGVVKFGRDGNGQQRFRCRPGLGCGRTFNSLTNSPLARMRKPEIWLSYAEALCERRSLDWIHERLGIARLTAWRWRHRFGRALAMRPSDSVAGVVETDEVFFLRSFKGHRGWKQGKPPEDRPPRYRGSGATKAGISSQQVPIVTAGDRNGGALDVIVAKPTDDLVVGALRTRIAPGSLICSDGAYSYPKLAAEIGGEHRTIKSMKPTPEQKKAGLSWRTPGALTLGRVNEHHATLKTAINRHFKGVSSRYLPNYLAWLHLWRKKPAPIAFLEAAAA
jgi:transposase-like protein